VKIKISNSPKCSLRACSATQVISKITFKSNILRVIVLFSAWACTAPNPTEGANSAPPAPLANLRGHTSKQYKGEEGKGKGENKGRGSEREGPAPFRKFLDLPLQYPIHIPHR